MTTEATTPSRRAGLRNEIAAALEAADYRMDMRRGDLADAVLPVLYREWPWLRAEAEGAPVPVIVPPAAQAAASRGPLTLSTPCASCSHPYNWHQAGICQADGCGCIAFAVDDRAGKARQDPTTYGDLAAALDGLHTLIATSSRDWQTYRVDAWIWAILCGWDCEQTEHDETCTHGALEETAAMHGWDACTVAKARRYRSAVRALTEPAGVSSGRPDTDRDT